VRKPLLAMLVLASSVGLSSCSTIKDWGISPSEEYDLIDPERGLSRSDYRNMAEPKANGGDHVKAELKEVIPQVPDVAEILTAPRPPKIGNTQLVSIEVTDDVPLKDVLIELSRLADVDMELDAGIKGGISFRAKEKPFNSVIERICNLADLRYTMEDGVLRVERDLPYIDSYALDFLNSVRTADNDISISTNVLSSSDSGESSDGLNTGSTTTITSSTESDFWESLEAGMEQIIAFKPASKVSPVIQFQDRTGMLFGNNPNNATPTTPTNTAEGDDDAGSEPFFIINQQAGILTISASQKQHQLVQRFLRKLEVNASAQVLIEAKIVEVTLDDNYRSGIRWGLIDGDNQFQIDFDNGNVGTDDFFSGSIGSTGGIDSLVNFTQNFGTTRTLSSPRLHAINNQQAVLTFAENSVYFELDVQREERVDSNGATLQPLITVDSTIRSIPIGIILNIQPSIDVENSEITLNVRPTLSRQVATVQDPAVEIAIADANVQVNNDIPVIEVRELDSILKVKSGGVMVIGGLMEERVINNDNGLPGLSGLPLLGNAFKNVDKTTEVTELVIFIRATIVGRNGNTFDADRNIYDKFINDPRPLVF
jgi:general secretion pathway protein D